MLKMAQMEHKRSAGFRDLIYKIEIPTMENIHDGLFYP